MSPSVIFRIVIVTALSLAVTPAAAEVRVLFAPLAAEVRGDVDHDARERPWTEAREPETDWQIEGRMPLTDSLDLNVGWYGIGEQRDNVMLGCVPASSTRDLSGLCIRQSSAWADFSAQGFSVSVEQLVRIGAIDFFGRVSVTELDIQTRGHFDMRPDTWRRRSALFGGGARWYPTERNWGLQAVATRSLDRETVLSAGFFVGF